MWITVMYGVVYNVLIDGMIIRINIIDVLS